MANIPETCHLGILTEFIHSVQVLFSQSSPSFMEGVLRGIWHLNRAKEFSQKGCFKNLAS